LQYTHRNSHCPYQQFSDQERAVFLQEIRIFAQDEAETVVLPTSVIYLASSDRVIQPLTPLERYLNLFGSYAEEEDTENEGDGVVEHTTEESISDSNAEEEQVEKAMDISNDKDSSALVFKFNIHNK
jgi:hypothetical protein